VPHSRRVQTRRAALPLCDAFFTRSKHFRALLCDRLPRFVELTAAPQPPDTPLPPPAAAQPRLKADAAALVSRWHTSFAQHYPQLRVAYTYLLDVAHALPDPAAPSSAGAQAAGVAGGAPRPAAPLAGADLEALLATVAVVQPAVELCGHAAHALLAALGVSLSTPGAAAAQHADDSPVRLEAAPHEAGAGATGADGADDGLDWEAGDDADASGAATVSAAVGEEASAHELALAGFDVADEAAAEEPAPAAAAGGRAARRLPVVARAALLDGLRCGHLVLATDPSFSASSLPYAMLRTRPVLALTLCSCAELHCAMQGGVARHPAEAPAPGAGVAGAAPRQRCCFRSRRSAACLSK
jgi:hypothetical protein